MKKPTVFEILSRVVLVLTVLQVVGLTVIVQRSRVKPSVEQVPNGERPTCQGLTSEALAMQLDFPRPLGSLCQFADGCATSYYTNPEASEEVHIVAVRDAYPTKQVKKGSTLPTVNVHFRETLGEHTLVLVNQGAVVWKLNPKEKTKFKKILLVGQGPSWVTGLPKGINYSRLGVEEFCTTPSAWEDEKNPENQFRKFIVGLRTYLKSPEKSFQGAEKGLNFRVPYPVNQDVALQKVTDWRKQQREEKLDRTPAAVASQTYKFEKESLSLSTFKGEELKPASWGFGPIQQMVSLSPTEVALLRSGRIEIWRKTPEGPKWHANLSRPGLIKKPIQHFVYDEKEKTFFASTKKGIFSWQKGRWNKLLSTSGLSLSAFAVDDEKILAINQQVNQSELILWTRRGQRLITKTLSETIPFLPTAWKSELSLSEKGLLIKNIKPFDLSGTLYKIDLLTAKVTRL